MPYGNEKGGGWNGGYKGNNQNSGWKGGNNQGGYKGGNSKFPKETGPVYAYKAYAATGNREAPETLKPTIERIVRVLEANGWRLRTGVTQGLEDMFYKCANKDTTELYLPWGKFKTQPKDPNSPELESKFSFCDERCLELTAKFHNAFDSLADWLKKVEARVTRMIFGQNLKSNPLFVIGWSEDGAETILQKTPKTGNFQTALTMAASLPIPIFNLQNPDAEQRLYKYLGINPNDIKKQEPVKESVQETDYNFDPEPINF